jgi:hypothetical protein
MKSELPAPMSGRNTLRTAIIAIALIEAIGIAVLIYDLATR